jgi:hypothetical protein
MILIPTNILTPMPSGSILVQSMNYAKSHGMPKPKTLEEMLRVKDIYLAEAAILN